MGWVMEKTSLLQQKPLCQTITTNFALLMAHFRFNPFLFCEIICQAFSKMVKLKHPRNAWWKKCLTATIVSNNINCLLSFKSQFKKANNICSIVWIYFLPQFSLKITVCSCHWYQFQTTSFSPETILSILLKRPHWKDSLKTYWARLLV